MRILALIPGPIANQLLFFPIVDALRVVYPNAKIDIVAEPRSIAAYKIKSGVAETFAFDFAGRSSLADWGNLLGIVRDREYNLAISPQLNWGTSFLLWMSGIPTRIGFSDSAGANFLTASVPRQPQQYTVAMYQDLLKPIGILSPSADIKVNLAKAEIDWADAERQRLSLNRYVVIHSVDAGYPVNSWESVLQDLQKQQAEISLVLLQDPQNTEFSLALQERIPTLKRVQPKTFGQTVAMLAGASLVICTEGDVLQAAVAAQVATLALFSTGEPPKLLPPDDRYISIKSSTGKLADVTPSAILEKLA